MFGHEYIPVFWLQHGEHILNTQTIRSCVEVRYILKPILKWIRFYMMCNITRMEIFFNGSSLLRDHGASNALFCGCHRILRSCVASYQQTISPTWLVFSYQRMPCSWCAFIDTVNTFFKRAQLRLSSEFFRFRLSFILYCSSDSGSEWKKELGTSTVIRFMLRTSSGLDIEFFKLICKYCRFIGLQWRWN